MYDLYEDDFNMFEVFEYGYMVGGVKWRRLDWEFDGFGGFEGRYLLSCFFSY